MTKDHTNTIHWSTLYILSHSSVLSYHYYSNEYFLCTCNRVYAVTIHTIIVLQSQYVAKIHFFSVWTFIFVHPFKFWNTVSNRIKLIFYSNDSWLNLVSNPIDNRIETIPFFSFLSLSITHSHSLSFSISIFLSFFAWIHSFYHFEFISFALNLICSLRFNLQQI